MSPDIISDVLNKPDPFSLSGSEKDAWFEERQVILHQHHMANCAEYERICSAGFHDSLVEGELPFLPVRVFKDFELRSVSETEIFKIMRSSGTSGQSPSKIVVDRASAKLQARVLAHIVGDFLGTQRRRYVIVDQDNLLRSDLRTSARAAAIIGFSNFGKGQTFVLNEDLEVKLDVIKSLVDADEPLLLFGFTFIVWSKFLRVISDLGLRFPKGTLLLHGGGWKKLISESVTREEFRELATEVGIADVHDYYGMIEQTGSIFMECEFGHFHCSNYSDIIVRNASSHCEQDVGAEGIIQVRSLLPTSYPGFNLLTEDMGVLLGVDGCKCGRRGKFFTVTGRMKRAEARGCSDTR